MHDGTVHSNLFLLRDFVRPRSGRWRCIYYEEGFGHQ